MLPYVLTCVCDLYLYGISDIYIYIYDLHMYVNIGIFIFDYSAYIYIFIYTYVKLIIYIHYTYHLRCKSMSVQWLHHGDSWVVFLVQRIWTTAEWQNKRDGCIIFHPRILGVNGSRFCTPKSRKVKSCWILICRD